MPTATGRLEEVGLSRTILAEKYRPVAEKQVRRHLILSKLIEQEKLELSDEELEKGLQEMADTYRQPIDSIKAFYNQDKDSLAFFKHTLLEKKALRIIIENGDIKEAAPETKSRWCVPIMDPWAISAIDLSARGDIIGSNLASMMVRAVRFRAGRFNHAK